MAKIFINYRRDDSSGYAGRLHDRLADHFGHDQLFMDINQIEPGEDSIEVIQEKLKAVQVAVVLIGKHWLDIADANGQRRLDNPDDWVRLEIVTLLERKIRVIPLLVGRANAPNSSQLPECLASLARRQAHEISDHRFHSDVDKLIRVLEKDLQNKTTSQPSNVSDVTQSPEVKLPEARLPFEPGIIRIPAGKLFIIQPPEVNARSEISFRTRNGAYSCWKIFDGF